MPACALAASIAMRGPVASHKRVESTHTWLTTQCNLIRRKRPRYQETSMSTVHSAEAVAPIEVSLLAHVRQSLQRIRAQARAGEKVSEGVTVDVTTDSQVDIEALFDAIAHEVEALIERTESFDMLDLAAAA